MVAGEEVSKKKSVQPGEEHFLALAGQSCSLGYRHQVVAGEEFSKKKKSVQPGEEHSQASAGQSCSLGYCCQGEVRGEV